MEIFDVTVVGGGPAGSTCAAFCTTNGLRTLLIEREKFPREKVCGDCLNPECWPILRRLGIDQRVRASPHGALDRVEFINLRESRLRIDLPRGENAEIAIKRSAFDSVLLERARELGAEVREASTLTSIEKSDGAWKLTTGEVTAALRARVLVAADGRNSTVARVLGLLPRFAKDAIAAGRLFWTSPGERLRTQPLSGGKAEIDSPAASLGSTVFQSSVDAKLAHDHAAYASLTPACARKSAFRGRCRQGSRALHRRGNFLCIAFR